MTFEQMFSGRMLLMRAQRHISQTHSAFPCGDSASWLIPGNAGMHAYQIVEQALQQLEREFDAKRARCKRRGRSASLARRADRQVTA